jgi:dTDP-glucose pyrophosphorylase
MNKTVNIIMALGGEGSRFASQGYELPKYLLAYGGSTMLYHSLASLRISGNVYFIARQEHLDRYPQLQPLLDALGTTIVAPHLTRGAAETLLLAEPHIQDLSLPMISINCDQMIKWNPQPFLDKLATNPHTSYIVTYRDTSPKCSYVLCETPACNSLDSTKVIEVREKQVISTHATVGIYHWSSTQLFFRCAQEYISTTPLQQCDGGEYYVAPVYNVAIGQGQSVERYSIEDNGGQFWPVGTPQDLNSYILETGDFI